MHERPKRSKRHAGNQQTSERPVKTRVLVVGAGPVGLTLAMDLACAEYAVTVVETRSAGEPPSVKCNHVAARSMEIFRRLGLAQKLRDAGLPADYPNDFSYRTTVTGIELSRIPIPCRRDRYTATDGPDTDWPTPEPPHRINQIYLEPILFAHAAAHRRASRSSTAPRSRISAKDDDGVVATVARPRHRRPPSQIHADFSSAATAARSMVRKAIGANLQGTPSSSACSRPISARPACSRLHGRAAPG